MSTWMMFFTDWASYLGLSFAVAVISALHWPVDENDWKYRWIWAVKLMSHVVRKQNGQGGCCSSYI